MINLNKHTQTKSKPKLMRKFKNYSQVHNRFLIGQNHHVPFTSPIHQHQITDYLHFAVCVEDIIRPLLSPDMSW